MGTDIGVKGSVDREAVERIAERRGVAADAMLRGERARTRLLFGRGALYRADIMGTEAQGGEDGPSRRGAI